MKKIALSLLLLIAVIFGLFHLQPVRQAIAQTACTVRTPVTILGFFADNVPAYSITPSNVRDMFCSLTQLDNNALIPGCVGDGVTDDTTCVQAAMTSATTLGGIVYLGPHLYAVSSTITITKEAVAGTTNGLTTGTYAGSDINSGFVGITANMNVLSLGSDVYMHNVSVIVNGSPTSGAAITTGATSYNDTMRDVYVGPSCIGMSISGNTINVESSEITASVGSGCYGMVIGAATTGAGTIGPIIQNTLILGNSTNRATAGMLIEDCGGCVLQNNDILYFTYGTQIIPGASQTVQWLEADNTVLGDTTLDAGLDIDTSSATGKVTGLNFNQSWAANNSTGPTVIIQNTSGGTVAGVWFKGQRVFSAPGAATNNVTIAASVSDVSFDTSQICGSYSSGTTNGVSVASGVTPVAFRANEISAICASQGGVMTNAINIAGTTTLATIVGNQLGGTNGLVGTLATGSNVSGNTGSWLGWDALQYYSNNGQTITTFGTGGNQRVTTWTKQYDRMNANFASGTFTAPIAGYYGVAANVTFAATSTLPTTIGQAFDAFIYVSSATVECFNQTPVTEITVNIAWTVSIPDCVVNLAAGGTIQLYVAQNTGASVNMTSSAGYTWLSIWYIQP